jgi:hypothetical protein
MVRRTADYSNGNNLLIRCQEKQRYRYFIRQNAGYWQTDSFSWALMAQMICSGETVGVQKGDSDWCWSTKIIALPPSVLQWWIHVAHGCLSITDNGGYLFAGESSTLGQCNDLPPVNERWHDGTER